MFQPSVAIPELIFRVVLVYAGVFLLLRVVGKRHVGELAPFDLVVLLILSECVQNALIGDDKSVTGGLIAAATLFGLNQIVSHISWRSKRAERLLEGTPRVLVRHGAGDREPGVGELRAGVAQERAREAQVLGAGRQVPLEDRVRRGGDGGRLEQVAVAVAEGVDADAADPVEALGAVGQAHAPALSAARPQGQPARPRGSLVAEGWSPA